MFDVNIFTTLKVIYAVVSDRITKYFCEDIYNSILKHVVVPYEHNGIQYKILVKKIRNAPKIMYIYAVDSEGIETDVTTEVKPFMGAFSNFHGIPTSSTDLGYQSLKFVYINGTSKIFVGKANIEL